MKFFKKIFKSTFSFIDRVVITPITKLLLRFTSKFDKKSRFFENWLSQTTTLLFISLFLAVVIFIVIDQKIVVFNSNSAEVLKNQPVKVIYNEEAYVVDGLPEVVDVTLIGNKTDLYIAKQSSTQDLTIDLSGLQPGTHRVNIEYNQNVGDIEYMVNPSVATVIIYQKVSETRTLSTDILNEDHLNSTLVVKDLKYDSDQVVVKGAEHQLKDVAYVKALVDIDNLSSQQVGTVSLKDVPLKAYDSNGEVVNVEIVPKSIDVNVELISPSKELPIKIIPKGEVSFGQAISSISTNETKVTVYGDEDVLEKLTYIPVELNVADLKTDKEFKVEISKPVGVKSLSTSNLTVNIKLGESSNKTLSGVGIEYRNLDETKYTVQAVDESASKVDVILKGVSNVINSITTDDVIAYIDLDQYQAGEYEVEVQVEGDDTKVQYAPKTKKVKIRIVQK